MAGSDVASILLRKKIIEKYEDITGWLYVVARNKCYDHNRAEKSRKSRPFSDFERETKEMSVLEKIADARRSPEEEVERIDDQQRIKEALEKLRPNRRRVFLLRSQGFEFHEIAQMLNMPEYSAKAFYFRARASLQKNLRNEKR